MPRILSINRKNNFIRLLVILIMSHASPALADIDGDEDETFYEITVARSFKAFRRKFGHYPKTWIELGVQDSCGGYQVDEWKHFPKAGESIIWKPSECELSYKLVFATKNSFRVVALAKGHVVSVYENFRATYYKTTFHDHGPYAGDDGKGVVY